MNIPALANSRSCKDFICVRDFLDRRGVVEGSDHALIDSITVLGPTILGSVLPFLGPITKLFASLPNGGRLAAVVVPLFLLVVSVSIICALSSTRRPSVGLSREYSCTSSYRFPSATRRAAKWMVLPLLLLSAYQIHAAGPNAVFFRTRIAGYVCSVSGNPITQGTLTAYDSFGGMSSYIPGQLDDIGYFVVELDPMSAAPKELHITGGPCHGVKIQAREGRRLLNGCETNPGTPIANVKRALTWSPACKP